MPPAPPAGNVVLTATDTVWLRIYDGNDKRLFEKEMAAGETYTVPADAQNPQILTGRPQALRVTIGGKEVAPLGRSEEHTSELKSLMRISYAVFCLKKKTLTTTPLNHQTIDHTHPTI